MTFSKSQYFHGIPQLYWDLLCQEAEDLFYDEEIGEIILGIYPVGDRVFGLETGNEELMVLYTDSPNKLLGPLCHFQSKDHVVYKVGDLNKTVVFVNIFNFVSRLIQGKETRREIFGLLYKMPSLSVLYEEESVSDIMHALNEYLNFIMKTKYFTNTYNNCIDIYDLSVKHKFLNMRARALFRVNGVFCPNINPDFGHVEKFDEIPKNEKDIIWLMLKNEFGRVDDLEKARKLILFYETIGCIEEYDILECLKLRENLNNTVIEFYKRLL